MRTKLPLVLALGAFALVAALGLWWAARGQLRVARQLTAVEDTAPALARLHREAASGRLRMLGPSTLEDALISAGFPPKRPLPGLAPRATVKGGAVGDAGGQGVAVVHYLADEGRFTVFTVPAKKQVLPADAAPVVRRGLTLHFVERDGVSLAFWKSGFWYTVLATQGMSLADRDLFVDLVRQAQGG